MAGQYDHLADVRNAAMTDRLVGSKTAMTPEIHPDNYSALTLTDSLSEVARAARSRLDFINKRREMLEAEYREAVIRHESEQNTLQRLVEGLNVALAVPNVSGAGLGQLPSDYPSEVRPSQLRNS